MDNIIPSVNKPDVSRLNGRPTVAVDWPRIGTAQFHPHVRKNFPPFNRVIIIVLNLGKLRNPDQTRVTLYILAF
jgi:hypothetical protein